MRQIIRVVLSFQMIITIILLVLMIYEYYQIVILENTDGYLWGTEGPNPWYYETMNLYIKYIFVSIIVCSSLILCSIPILSKPSKINILVFLVAEILAIYFFFFMTEKLFKLIF